MLYFVRFCILSFIGLVIYQILDKKIFIFLYENFNILIPWLFAIFILFYIVKKFFKAERQEETSILLDDDIFKDLDDEKVEPILNIIKAHKSKKFFSMALVGGWGIGKSTYIYNLEEKLKKDFYTININVWQLENMHDILQEFEKEYINIIYKESIFLCLKIVFYKLTAQSYFTALEDLTSKNISKIVDISLLSSFLTPSIKQRKKAFNSILNELSKKVVVFVDEVDRLHDTKDIKEVFKLLRQFMDFDNTFLITAVDLKQVESKVENIEFIHKIFHTKYEIAPPTLYDFINFLEVKKEEKNIEPILKSIIEILLKDDMRKESLFAVITTFRELKSAINEAYLVIKTIKENNRFDINDINKYCELEFIVCLSIIKSVDYKMYQDLIDNKNYKNIFKEKIKKEQSKFEKIFKTFRINITYIEQFMYIYKFYKVYDWMITPKIIKNFEKDINNIQIRYKELPKNNYKINFIENILNYYINEYIINNDRKFISYIINIILSNYQNNQFIIKNIFNQLSNLSLNNNTKIFFDTFIDEKFDYYVYGNGINKLLSQYIEDKEDKNKKEILFNWIKDIDNPSPIGFLITNDENFKNNDLLCELICYKIEKKKYIFYNKELKNLKCSQEIKELIKNEKEYSINTFDGEKIMLGKELKQNLFLENSSV